MIHHRKKSPSMLIILSVLAILLFFWNIDDAPHPKTDPHICNKVYGDIQDFDEDLADLVATCQRHTRCSAAYCLRTHNGQQKCHFGYPKPLQSHTTIVLELFSQQGMMAWLTATALCSCQLGMLT